MLQRTIGRAALAVLVGLVGLTVTTSSAGAVPTCDISMFPAVQASQSSLHFSCLFANGATTATNEVSSTFTLHDFQNAEYHKGAARTVKVTVAAVAGTGAITAAGGHFTSAEINRPVSGAGIPARAFIKSLTATTITLNVAHLAVPLNAILTIENSTARTAADVVTVAGSATVTSATANFNATDLGKSILASTLAANSTISAVNSPTSVTVSPVALASTGTGYPVGCTTGGLLPTCNPPVVTIGATQSQSTTRSVADATNTTTTITSASAKWESSDLGLKVSGPGIPATAYIASFAGNVATIAGGPMTANATAHAIVIGEPSPTAPTDGSAVVQLQSAINLNPALAAGSDNCALATPEAFSQVGTWRNPGSFQTPGIYGPQPTNGQAIAQIAFASATITFYAYVMKLPASTVGDPQAAAHYDLVFPFFPTAFAKCPAPDTVKVGTGVSVLASTVSQNAVPVGIGRPYSAWVRSLAAGATGVKSATLKSNSTTFPANWSIPKSCTIPAANGALAFSCGYG